MKLIFREISWALNNLHMLGECFIEQRHQYVLTSVICEYEFMWKYYCLCTKYEQKRYRAAYTKMLLLLLSLIEVQR